MLLMPYGLSNFATVATQNYYFVDRTHYLEKLDNLGEKYIFFLRPRRFGKSLWVSLMQYYYGVQYKAKFSELFGKYYIGQHPTHYANQYLILCFDFSGIDTQTAESTYQGFLWKVKMGVEAFFADYPQYFSAEEKNQISALQNPEWLIGALFGSLKGKNAPNIYLLIDEYDHFANELLALNLSHFKDIMGKNGWVRKFYETIKTATRDGIVDRLFVTGVSPATLDSMTSGFNISSSLTMNISFHNMMGFVSTEVEAILQNIGISETELPYTMEQVRLWYDGYKMNKEAKEHLYNPDMVLYFAKEYISTGSYPEEMLDVNIASDYGKIRRIFEINNQEEERVPLLLEIVENGKISSPIVPRFNFELDFTQHDFLSLLFYMGMLSIEAPDFDGVILRTPNYVMKELYYKYYYKLLEERQLMPFATPKLRNAVLEMAKYGKVDSLKELLQAILLAHSNRDKANFSEKHIKTLFITLFYVSGIYLVDSEPETERKYMDVLLIGNIQYNIPYNYLFELKYIKKKSISAKELANVRQETIAQLEAYKSSPKVQNIANLQSYILIVVDKELKILEQII